MSELHGLSSLEPTPSDLYTLSPSARRSKRYAARVEQNFLDGQVNCPRKGPMHPQISVTMCESMHKNAPAECQRCACRLHLVAPAKAAEIQKNRSNP